MNAIRPAQFDDWLAQAGQDQPAARPVLLDVREPWEFQTASVPPAEGFDLVHMPMRSVPARFAELDRDQPIACLCHHGARSAQVAYFLADQGFTRVVNVQGGIDAWSHERDRSVPQY
ncbi:MULTISPECIES: rhodanese-like domain-containing protein [Hydrogenophaga]|uniref:Rhodanese-like domain-containing protein n=1 Tax=Hydrogenophaga electricum TaxID=1230953 RepID=A0ABQ6C9K9_9BURK|nr:MULTISPECIES: rhodanese-like domain-containing protein [Hydrogenophaga]GLS16342.1 rhodanese-like domain-containing protein [Hydrogenophaga electricum]